MRESTALSVALPMVGLVLFFLAAMLSTVAWSKATGREGRTDYKAYLSITLKWPYVLSWVFFLLGLGIFFLSPDR